MINNRMWQWINKLITRKTDCNRANTSGFTFQWAHLKRRRKKETRKHTAHLHTPNWRKTVTTRESAGEKDENSCRRVKLCRFLYDHSYEILVSVNLVSMWMYAMCNCMDHAACCYCRNHIAWWMENCDRKSLELVVNIRTPFLINMKNFSSWAFNGKTL